MIIAYDHIVLLRDRLAGCLRGFLLFSFTRKKNYTIFYVSSSHDNCILSNVTCLFRNNISKNIVVEICRLQEIHFDFFKFNSSIISTIILSKYCFFTYICYMQFCTNLHNIFSFTLQLGTTILDHQYRGGPYMYIASAYAVLKGIFILVCDEVYFLCFLQNLFDIHSLLFILLERPLVTKAIW